MFLIAIDFDKKQRQERIPVEYFDPYGIDRATLHPIRFAFGIVKPEQREKVSNMKEYDMSRSPHGIALIINNECFKDKERRVGTHVDQRHLAHIFRYLDYNVEVHREVDSQQMIAIMTDMGKRSHDEYDSFVCCILSHGNAGHVLGTDSEEVSLDVLTQKIDAGHCPSLHKKPKMFFIHASRGNLKEEIAADGQPYHDDSREMTVTVGADKTDMTDFFFGYATRLGYVAFRDFNHGSLFINELCRTLGEMCPYASLHDIMTEVSRRVANGYSYLGYKMTPEMTSHLQASVYF